MSTRSLGLLALLPGVMGAELALLDENGGRCTLSKVGGTVSSTCDVIYGADSIASNRARINSNLDGLQDVNKALVAENAALFALIGGLRADLDALAKTHAGETHALSTAHDAAVSDYKKADAELQAAIGAVSKMQGPQGATGTTGAMGTTGTVCTGAVARRTALPWRPPPPPRISTW